MPTIFPTSPHFDDYDESKQFVRILFRPGRAVQARELTQLQTIIQAQVERFGKGIYKDGSFVSPPSETLDERFSFVKLLDSFNSITTDSVITGLVGQTVIGQTSAVKAIVIDVATTTADGDPPTLFVKYTDGGINNQETFSDNEEIKNAGLSVTVKSTASESTGFGTAFSIGQSTVFAKGNFLFVPQQTHIVEKYSSVQNKLIGFTVSESIIDSNDDSSLLDPATGTFNFFAPGADRYKANLTLSSRALEFASNTDTNFIEIIRIEDGIAVSKNIDPRFSVLGDTLARRTFEESGNYVVDPFSMELREHYKITSTGRKNNVAAVVNTGVFNLANGGDNAKFVSVITPGQSYVKGYEVDNVGTRYLTIDKARDFANVTNGVVASQISSFIDIQESNSIPDTAVIENLILRDQYKSSNAGQNGAIVGTAKSRGFLYKSGNVSNAIGNPLGDGKFKLYLFDVQMNSGKSFDRDVKHIVSDTFEFAANITPVLTNITGAVTYNAASSTVRGSGTRFQTELKVGDLFSVSNATVTERYQVATIVDDVTLTTTAAPHINLQLSGFFTYATAQLNTANIGDSDKDTLVVKFPQDVIKAVDPANTKTTYTVKRQVTQSLSSGAATITAGTNETFSPFSADNYTAVITSGARKGQYINIQSGDIAFNGAFTEVTFDFSGTPGENLTNETMEFIVTVNKITSAALRKTKTLVENATIDFSQNANALVSVISLGKADGFRLKSVKMANVETQFGMPYTTDRESNITSRYTFDTGQKATFYDTAKIRLKPTAGLPERPIRVTFDHFTHGSGDFCSVGSYANYETIPEVFLNGELFPLRDCLDFRPVINDAGTGFSGTGSQVPEFLDPGVNFKTDYQFHLPKINSIGLDENGNYFVVNGKSELNPREPNFPSDLLKLYVLKQKPFVFNLNDDIEIKKVENKRFTMKDIGKIENRVKTLEFYTSLNLLERDAQQEQIQDELGFERFKNGFVVDSFTGHGVGDSLDNPDYACSVNFTKKEASPLIKSKFINLKEKSTSTAQRESNNYTITNEVISLPYTHEVLVQNPFSSKVQNLNPFNINVFQGFMTLGPPGDLWFDDRRVPDVEVDRTGTFDSLSSQSLIKKNGENIFGSINDIEQLRNGIPQDTDELPDNLKGISDLIGSVSPATSSVKLQGNDVVKNITVVPKMRDVSIRFVVDGMRPNTSLHAFFDEINVTSFCTQNTTVQVSAEESFQGNVNTTTVLATQKYNDLSNAYTNAFLTPLQTDSTGSISGVFNYSSSSLNINTGQKLFRLTNSSRNDRAQEISYAEQIFVSDGVIREISREVLRPPPPPPPPVIIHPQPDPGPQTVEPPTVNVLSTLEKIYVGMRGVPPNAEEVAYWNERAPGIATTAWGDADSNPAPNQASVLAELAHGFAVNGIAGNESGAAQAAGAEVNRDGPKLSYFNNETTLTEFNTKNINSLLQL